MPRCRGCDHGDLLLILDLGRVPLANALLDTAALDKPEERFPLALYFCPLCTLVQIGETVPADKLFAHYFYASSFSETWLVHVRTLVERLVGERNLGPQCLVVEVASNDGYLLQYYKALGVPILGIEPASNIAAVARNEHGIPTVVEFFNAALGARLSAEGTHADVIHAHNVFAHVSNPNEFIIGLRHLLKIEGVAVIEVPYVRDLVEHLEFDTIYHEHFSYYSVTAIDNLCRRNGMRLADVERIPTHGGSLRLIVGHEAATPSRRVADLLEDERTGGMTEFGYYRSFANRIWALRNELLAVLEGFKSKGKRLAAYGASAKGSTLMNTFDIGPGLLDFVVDRSTLKQGRFTPGNHLPILAPDMLMKEKPDGVLLLTWNFVDEILRQQEPYRAMGGRFIVPLPTVAVV